MAIMRVEKTRDYTTMSNYHFKDKNMSLKAKGLLSLILSLPEEWDYTIEGLSRLSKDGVDSVRTALKELMKFGYIEMARVRDEKGKLRGTEYVVYEKPVSHQSDGGEPIEEEQVTENPVIEESVIEESVLEEPVCQKSIFEKPILENPILGKSILEYPGQLNTNILNIQELNTNISNQNARSAEKITPEKKLNNRRTYYPDSEQLNDAFKAFVYMRKRINKPLTNTAIRLTKDSLAELACEDGKLNVEKAIGILNQSIMHSWPGLYALKAPIKNKEQPCGYSTYSVEEWENLERQLVAN